MDFLISSVDEGSDKMGKLPMTGGTSRVANKNRMGDDDLEFERGSSDEIQAIDFSTRNFQLMDIENDYFLLKFQLAVDYTKVLSGDPSVIFEHSLTFQPWSSLFCPSISFSRNVIAWICLHGLSGCMYKRSILTTIGNMIGEVIKIDRNTNQCAWGCYISLAVSVIMNKPLIASVRIYRRLQCVEYESLLNIFF
ncbi:hypothetical protein PVK06_009857 [Gossypium arboreum]|uniref:DUF4283 domain-containing protein n=1 Tax=Gossypium arboreum TaxID=29729 RepID=A0ABR0QPM5_GOSAR|nr:hypothetical protein PVK06_009857 [Gossypium arboreum]